ncbi:hypothetical protein [Photobacterium indicum]|uniref:hypothetical protein n=1 Tax=Photobacterium indicum TaxID=81447 RepID=UPI003D1430D4
MSTTQYKFDGFILDILPESPETPMQITSPVLTIELPRTGAFHHYPLDENGTNVVMFKMDNSTKNPPEVSLQMSDVELEVLKKISVLPIIS